MRVGIRLPCVLVGLFSVLALYSQKPTNLYAMAITETYSFPFTRFGPIHPGLELGTCWWEKSKRRSVHQLNTFLGGYYHRKVENGFYLRGEYAYRYKINQSLGIDAPVGVGYQHSFFPGEIYEQDATSGEWKRTKQVGKPHGLITFGLGLTWLRAGRFQPMVRYESTIDFPMYNGFVTTRTFFKLGVNVILSQDE